MRRAAVVLVAFSLVLPAWAAAAPRGAPRVLRPAVPADHASRPAALAEYWAMRLVDPRSRAWLEIRVVRSPDERGVRLLGEDAGGGAIDDAFGADAVRATRTALSAGSADGRLEAGGTGRRVSLSGAAATGALRLARRVRGPAALGWRLGEAPRAPSFAERPVTAAWSMPVATSRVRGALALRDGRRLELRGWRASYEHGWGDMLLEDREWEYADSAIVHGGQRRAWVLHGLDRADTVTGPGARDAQWLGLLARVSGRRVQICRPRIDRRGWLFTYPDLALWASRLRARCGGISIALRDRPGRIDEYLTHVEARGRSDAGRRRSGLVTHISHPQR